ncbi:MAG: glycosyltransferase [Candidatus Fibromonas sp.]|jgi:glycosyltransferase involved in cell wall biosynthesis|nr:glycosyltransferase [Candidatus Fibromonas sp.]
MQEDFQQTLQNELSGFLLKQQNRFPISETIKIDLHCHDRNSDVPDELIGRILNVPETWLPSERLIEVLKKNGCNTFTITNHNNGRSCYTLQDRGLDVLTAAEFSCMVPDFGIGIHVLAYGFTPEQEVKLEKLRRNIYRFQEYARAENIPTTWAHPLYHYAAKKNPPQEFFNKMLLVFERFEMLNGQRDSWQNLLVKEWLEQITPENIDKYAKAFDTDPKNFCADPYHKAMTGGSDCHSGLFAGMSGTYLHLPNLEERLKTSSYSQLALEAIRNKQTAPFGAYQNTQKMTLAFLHYACQIALNYKDPGLLRLLLHKGDSNDKLIAFAASNLFCEVQKHSTTTSFVKIFLDSMIGKKPHLLKKLLIKPVYKPIFNEAINLAEKYNSNSEQIVNEYYNSILAIHNRLNNILIERLNKKIDSSGVSKNFENGDINSFIEKLELPLSIRAYLDDSEKRPKEAIDVSGFLDGLSFPFFCSLFILSAHFTSAKTLFNTRPLLSEFSGNLGKYCHPKRIMWLTDTFGDSNGVAMFLKEMHSEIKKRNLPIDIVCCNSSIAPEDNLVVLKPLKEFTLPQYKDYTFRIPNFVELHNLFFTGSYDRIICSTEGIMGMFGLYLKHAYTVKASFYMHTDWLMFARKVLNIEGHNLSRVRRILRSFYKAFDKVLVLNSDQKTWLSGTHMNLDPENVSQTAHWVNSHFTPQTPDKKQAFDLPENTPVLLYVGRVSNEKGVLELPAIYQRAKRVAPELKVVVAGKGPAQEQLKKEMPDAIFLDWVQRDKLPLMYASADLLVLPSRFDTFAMVVLEALSCGLPAIAYNTKGPKDIIKHGQCGFLVETPAEMQEQIAEFLQNGDKAAFRKAAAERAAAYQPDVIIAELMEACHFLYSPHPFNVTM